MLYNNDIDDDNSYILLVVVIIIIKSLFQAHLAHKTYICPHGLCFPVDMMNLLI